MLKSISGKLHVVKEEGMLVLLRHAESVWNQKNRFTGWIDIPLSPKGIEDSLEVGEKLKNFSFTKVFVSNLTRTEQTAMLVLSKSNQIPYIVHPDNQHYSLPEFLKKEMLPVYVTEALNERYYGDLQGLDKDEMRVKYGAEQVHIWRRSFDVSPPRGESLKLCSERTLPWFEQVIVPLIRQGEKILIVAHGNSLRSIVMGIKKLTEEEVLNLEIATGEMYSFSYQAGIWTEKKL
jgi:2,3-bisphosphoglycerate-dependent phosphoglycerate mutase